MDSTAVRSQRWLHPLTRIANPQLVDAAAYLKTLRSAKLPPDPCADFIASGVSGREASGRLTGIKFALACVRSVRYESLGEPGICTRTRTHPSRYRVCLSRRVSLLFLGSKFKRDKIRLLYSYACGIVSTYGIWRRGDRDAAPSLMVSLHPHLPLLQATP
jgi:hypothetical protein